MFFTVYKITNTTNGKFYIGMHKTDNLDDGYMGSGIRIKNAIKKYGIECFQKEILFVFDNENDMKNKEKELVVVDEHTTYNLCDGGKGGFSYINRSGLNTTGVSRRNYAEIARKVADKKKSRNYKLSEEHKQKISEAIKNNEERGKKISKSLSGKTKSDEHKRKISEALKLRNSLKKQ